MNYIISIIIKIKNNTVNNSRIGDSENGNINISDSENNSIVTHNVLNSSIGENRGNFFQIDNSRFKLLFIFI